MAIGDLPSSPPQVQPIDIEAWTEQATVSLEAVTIATPGHVIPGTSATLAIPLDDRVAPVAPARPAGIAAAANQGGYYRRKEPVRRDSMKSREAFLKGKEGSRRRQRWENDRLLHNPHATPPLPRDWEVHPTHPSKPVPYALAPLWDAGLARQSAARKTTALAPNASSKKTASHHTAQGVVPKELRDKLKHSRSAKGLLMDLEGQVRSFIAEWGDREQRAAVRGLPADPDSEDDEIVFVGRNGVMNDRISDDEDGGVDTASRTGKRELMLFETPEGDVGGAFGRWLVHQIGVYYGLRTWSVTVGSPARRQAYIGVKGAQLRVGNTASIY